MRAKSALIVIAKALLLLASWGVVGYAIVAYGTKPAGATVHPEMMKAFQANLPVVYAHVFGSAVALILGPLQFSKRLRAKAPAVHRVLGRAYLFLGVGVGGVAGLWMSTFAYGGLTGRLAFATLAVLWLVSAALALRAILRRDIAAHKRWMIRNFAMTFAAVTLRIMLGTSFALDLPFGVAYPVIAWICWPPNLLVAEWIIRRSAGGGAGWRRGAGAGGGVK